MQMSTIETQEVSSTTSIIRVPKTCKAGLDNGARCRNWAIEGSDFCSLPAHQSPTATLSATPDVVLAWFKLNDKQFDRLERFLNVQTRSTRRQRQINEKHAEQAKAMGRNAHIRATIVDSGSPVFGKMGVQGHNVWACNVLEDLGNAGYFLCKAEVGENELPNGGKVKRLLLELRLEGDVFEGSPMKFLGDAFSTYADAPFQQVLVWANPPKSETGEIVHTLNFRGRNPDAKPDCILHYDGVNDWFLAATPPDQPDAPVIA
jgi:hypothetical protein